MEQGQCYLRCAALPGDPFSKETMQGAQPRLLPTDSHACLCRSMSIIREINAALRLVGAALRLRSATTEFDMVDDQLRVKTLSGLRAGCFVMVQAVRIIIALSLGVGGMRFLVRTISLEDLLLNSMALEVCIGRMQDGQACWTFCLAVVCLAFLVCVCTHMTVCAQPLLQLLLFFFGPRSVIRYVDGRGHFCNLWAQAGCFPLLLQYTDTT